MATKKEIEARLQERKKLEKYYEDVLDTLRSPGWKHLTEDWEKQRKVFDSTAGVETLEKLWFQKGIVNNIDYLFGLRDQFERARDQLDEEESGE